MWRVHEDIGEDKSIHVWPADTIPKHITEGKKTECWCKPTLEIYPGAVLVTHNDIGGKTHDLSI